ncbi:acylneuraminate cytidylyltransferase family protein [Tenacibaculum aquimarinum]|uniref:acylneuraminate cytidylyltransferase family protein n=1 Tax=Tenacibaculum aquimarinum TaxID=2910675 RepID=UPI001F0ADD11|nr:acylneuraminate cytidylyltransferase family protein [Tenacibaculum aquimarinum]MCH3884988.1 acylneuraminate cytidylyltransferase family protein [Tenacibaculum aquimarinum]
MKKSKNIVIIPARGGSKRFPNKNIALFENIPLIVHSINYAKKNNEIIDKIVVSTDNAEIKDIALKNGVMVIDRPKSLSGDLEPTITALKHVIDQLKEDYDNVILLQITNPLRPCDLLKKAFLDYEKGNYDSLMTVSRNKEKLGKIIGNQFVPFNYTIGQRSQDLEPLYFENGLLYISKTNLIYEEKILGENCFPYIVEHPFSKVDIDTKEDFLFAHFILRNYNE